jgi:hypothetical protein
MCSYVSASTSAAHFLSPHQLGACLAASVTAMIAIYLKMLLFTFFLVETVQKRDYQETQSKREEFKLIQILAQSYLER